MKHILVVDDNKANLAVAKQELIGDYQVTPVISGAQALKFLEKKHPDLILLDVIMPEMDGKETLRHIRTNPQWAKIPIIFLTGDTSPETEAECLALGADDFLGKPFVPVVMKKRIERVLELAELRENSYAAYHKPLSNFASDLKSSTDTLTGLYNRNYTESTVDELMKSGHSGVLFIIEMDNLRQINDDFGHIAGDRALKIFADTIKANADDNDIVCRIGGDKFLIYFTDMTNRSEAAERAEKIVNTLSARFSEQEYGDTISASIGIALGGKDGHSFCSLYNNAGKSLYYVKKTDSGYSFYSDDNTVDGKGNTVTDLNTIRCMIEGKINDGGILSVAYDEFQCIYNFISRSLQRSHRIVQTILFTLSGNDGKYPDSLSLDTAINVLETAVSISLRTADVGTKYSSSQYIIILMDADIENGKKVAERVMERFYNIYKEGNITVSYDIQTMQPKGESHS